MYRIDCLPPQKLVLEAPECDLPESTGYVRQCAFSDDGSILVGVNDASQVIQFDRVDSSPDTTSEMDDDHNSPNSHVGNCDPKEEIVDLT